MGKSRGKESWHYCCWKHSIAIIKSGAKGSPFVVRWCSKLLPQRKKKQHHQIDKWQTDFHFLSACFFCCLFVPHDISIFPLCHFLTSLLQIWDDWACLNATTKIVCSTLPSHCSTFWRNGFIQITTFGQQKTTFSRIYVGTVDFCMRSVDFCMRKVEQKTTFSRI